MLTVTTAAADRSLLTVAELRSATGADSSYDDDLMILGARVAASLARQCCVPSAGAVPPTFRVETLTEVFRDECTARSLRLSRRPIVSIDSVVVDGSTLDPSAYEANEEAGVLYRLISDARAYWSASKITVVYDAGWDVVPDDLKLAAAKLARILWSEDGPGAREPGVRRVRTDGVDDIEYWVPPASDPLLSAEIGELLIPYKYMAI